MDLSQYMDAFLIEAREHLQNMNQSLLALENDPAHCGMLGEMFRSAHTLKGMAATMGFDRVSHLTHEMENVLSDLREQKSLLNPETVDLLFQCLDVLEQLIDAIEAGQEKEFEISDILKSLLEVHRVGKDGAEAEAAAVKKKVGFELNQYELNLLNEAISSGFNAFHLKVEVIPDCLMKSVRVYMVFKNLEEIGEVVKCVPPVPELEEGSFEREFELLLLTREGKEPVSQKINAVSEVRLISCESIPAAGQARDVDGQREASGEPPRESKAAAVEDNPSQAGRARKTVRVDIERLDNLMNLVGELVINKTRLVQIGQDFRSVELNDTVEHFDRISTDLQNLVMKVRMVPVEQVFNRFPRMVRDLAKELGKEVNFVIEGKETELDRTVIDEIGDPLLHLLRNSVDHGIERQEMRRQLGKDPEGRIVLSARHEGNHVVIEVEDDGRGIDLERIRTKAVNLGLAREDDVMDEQTLTSFIFQPGFSTAESVTDLSGRGVGLDVVKARIESLNGSITLETEMGRGARFQIRLPLTLAIIMALLVEVGGEYYAIPINAVDETTMIDSREIRAVQKQRVTVLRGKVLPIIHIADLIGAGIEHGERELPKELYVVVVRRGLQRVGLVVDELIGQQEIVIKSLGRRLAGIPGLAGATILGNGRPSLILDVGTLF